MEEESGIPTQRANDNKYVLGFLVFTFPTPILFDPSSLPLAVQPPLPPPPPSLRPLPPLDDGARGLPAGWADGWAYSPRAPS